MSLGHIAPLLEADQRNAVRVATFGHLAPKRNKTYRGRVVFAFGCYNCGDLNPVVLLSDFGDLDDSPWLYDALHDFLDAYTPGETGTIHEWKGTFRNYSFKGTARLILRVE